MISPARKDLSSFWAVPRLTEFRLAVCTPCGFALFHEVPTVFRMQNSDVKESSKTLKSIVGDENCQLVTCSAIDDFSRHHFSSQSRVCSSATLFWICLLHCHGDVMDISSERRYDSGLAPLPQVLFLSAFDAFARQTRALHLKVFS